MSQLSTQRYLNSHRFLRDQWLRDPGAFSRISTQEQWDLHRYFRLFEPLTETDLLEHRRQVDDKSLPRRADRALARFKLELKQLAVRQANVKPVERIRYKRDRRPYNLKVSAQVKPEIDVDQLARAIVDIAFDEVRNQASV